MKILKERQTPLQSKNKLVTAMNLFEKYVDEPVRTIEVYGDNYYLINNKWSVNISDNSVSRTWPDPE
jgi:hypothetical protein